MQPRPPVVTCFKQHTRGAPHRTLNNHIVSPHRPPASFASIQVYWDAFSASASPTVAMIDMSTWKAPAGRFEVARAISDMAAQLRWFC